MVLKELIYRFPKNLELKQQWVKAIKCDNFEPSSHSRVCSKHFTSDCFVGSPWSSKRILSVTAIPNASYVCETQHMQEMDIPNVPVIETENETAIGLDTSRLARFLVSLYIGRPYYYTYPHEHYLQLYLTY